MAQQQQLTEQEIIATYRGMRSEIKQLAEKMSELEMEVNEHQRVLETLEPLSPTRKAYRKIGGVLIERTVREVKPAISNNKDGIVEVIKSLSTALKEKEAKASEWQVRKCELHLAKTSSITHLCCSANTIFKHKRNDSVMLIL